MKILNVFKINRSKENFNNKCKDLYNAGHTISEIAIKLKVSKSKVYNIVAKNKILSDEAEDKITRLKASGKNAQEISEILGINRSTIEYHLLNNRRINAINNRDTIINDIDLENIKSLYSSGYSVSEIYTIIGKKYTKDVIRYRLIKCGLYKPTDRNFVTDKEREKMYTMYITGLSYSEIGRTLNRSRNTVSKNVNHYIKYGK